MRATAMPKARPTQFELIQPGRRMRQVGNSSFFATKAARHLNCPLLLHEVLNRKRPLTLKMIRRLHEGLGIPAESLIKVGQQEWAV